ncbi:hypothetical protein CORC01_14353 [Colletotrichum orchidophilum]|uniref:Uncharacterized protein n=1 Tax=Colletotrichum orchidophilum TaxID=1209926 RepID=A0A1G4AMJ8_9PEZI|nr:uncharacterized protein CORC01_14353 [Colletotrichum orchidophilum]OHE90351.1 hypothetical protein CORC01_14353 [Colletotrichum orchidophilum]
MASQALRSLNLRAAAAAAVARTPFRATSIPMTATRRTLTGSAARRLAYKDTQDRESLNPSSNEGTRTGRDSEVAHEKKAFDPSTTQPKGEKKEDSGTLDVSGANQAVSKPQGDNPGKEGAGKETRKVGSSSGAGSAPKAGRA